jgi:acyl-coenzyme A thioesterase PaaI-like protein
METWPKAPIDVDRNELCFGCGKKNPIGLKLDFEWDGKTARTQFTPTEFYQGWTGIVHGGILNSILDEAMAYAAIFEGLHCITARMETRIKRPARVGEALLITSSVTKKSRKIINTKASITLEDGTLVAEGTSSQFIIKAEPEKSRL